MDFWFIFKKITSIGLTPVAITIELVVIGVLLVRFSRRMSSKKPNEKLLWLKGKSGDLGTYMIAGACLFLYLCSIESIAFWLSSVLERKYPPLEEERIAELAPEFIVVLPGGHRHGNAKPVYSLLARKTFVRLTQGIEYWKRFPEASLVFTGMPAEVEPMRDLAIGMGVDQDKIIEELESRDTKDHARYLRSLLTGKRFILVTSGNHMPRSVALFQGQDLNPIPAPTDFHTTLESEINFKRLVPKARNLLITDEAFHEHLGLGWAALRRQLKEREIATEETIVKAVGVE